MKKGIVVTAIIAGAIGLGACDAETGAEAAGEVSQHPNSAADNVSDVYSDSDEDRAAALVESMPQKQIDNVCKYLPVLGYDKALKSFELGYGDSVAGVDVETAFAAFVDQC